MSAPLRRFFLHSATEEKIQEIAEASTGEMALNLPAYGDDVVEVGDHTVMRRLGDNRGAISACILEITRVGEPDIMALPGGRLARFVDVHVRRVL